MASMRKLAGLLFVVLLVLIPGVPGFAKTTITFWHDWGGEGGEVIESLVNAFNKSQQDVEVKVVLTTSLGQKLMAAVAGGAAPDVVLLDRYTTNEFAANGALTRLDDLIKGDKLLQPSTFFPATWREANWRGAQYGIPTQTDSRVLLFLKSVLEEAGISAENPPDTWDELRQASVKLTRRQADGKLTRAGYVPTWGNISAKDYIWQNGGELLNPELTKVVWDSQAAVEAIQWVVEFADFYGGLGAIDAFGGQVDWSIGGPLGPMLKGQVAILYEGSWTLGEVLRNFPDIYQNDLGAGLPPLKVKRATLSGGHGLVIPAGTPAARVKAALEFIRYFVSPETQVRFALGTGVIPANVQAAVNKQLVQDPVRRVFIQAMEFAHIRPPHPAYPSIEGYLWDAWWRSLRHEAAVQAALEESARKAQQVLDRYNKHYGIIK